MTKLKLTKELVFSMTPEEMEELFRKYSPKTIFNQTRELMLSMTPEEKEELFRKHPPKTITYPSKDHYLIKNNGAVMSMQLPDDFLDYFQCFMNSKIGRIVWLSDMVSNAEKGEDLERYLKIVYGDDWATLFENKSVSETLTEMGRFYSDTYTIYDFDERKKLGLTKEFCDYDNPRSIRPVFLDYFSMQLWVIVQYLQNSDIPLDIDTSDMQTNMNVMLELLAKLVNNTVYTDSKIEMPSNIDLTKYDLGTPHKLPNKELIYGKFFIQLSKTYQKLLEFWKKLYSIDPELAGLSEKMLCHAARTGVWYQNFRYQLNCGTGGKEKDKNLDYAKSFVYKAYSKIKDKKIAAEQIVNQLFDPETGIETDKRYENLETKTTCFSTILKWVKEWDKGNGINRKGFPRAKRSIHK